MTRYFLVVICIEKYLDQIEWKSNENQMKNVNQNQYSLLTLYILLE